MPNNPKQPNRLDSQREAVIMAALPHVPFDGWSEATLQRAAAECDIDAALLPLLFPKGALDAIAFHSHWTDTKVATELARDKDFANLPVHLKIRTALLKRLELATDEKEVVRKAMNLLSLPQNAATGLKLLHASCDSMWQLAGDASTDYNWYTKRMILGGVYSSTLLFWLNDESAEMAETKAFLDRRLGNVKAFGKWKAECQNWFKSPFTKQA